MKAKLLALCLLLAALPTVVLAEKGDREKPINVEADRVSIDDIKKVQIFEGNVVMSQGTLQLRTSKLVVTQDADGFQKGVATGGPNGLARFRQKREGKEEYIEGEGERIEYKAGWNPDAIIRTLCAFANDFENLGGGYVVIGQDCDAHGQPVFPPVGLADHQLDKIQQVTLVKC